jgi:CheY-like chemotaxis protein
MNEKRTPTMDKRTIRILLVDDHPVLRRGVRDTLAAEMDIEVCAEVGDAASALKALEARQRSRAHAHDPHPVSGRQDPRPQHA